MSERHDIVLREVSGSEPNPPGLISELRDLVGSVFTETLELTGAQVRQLHKAILSGLSLEDLEILVRCDLDEQLDNIASNGSLSAVVSRVIRWAEKHGRIEELIRAVQRARPTNKAIQSVAASLLGAGWSKGKSQQEIAHATEIRASAMEKLGKLEIERIKLIKERDEIILKEETQRNRDELANRERMFELKTERLKAVVDALRVVKDLDVRLHAKIVRGLESVLADIAESPDP